VEVEVEFSAYLYKLQSYMAEYYICSTTVESSISGDKAVNGRKLVIVISTRYSDPHLQQGFKSKNHRRLHERPAPLNTKLLRGKILHGYDCKGILPPRYSNYDT
jgi:hypothetical protein